MARDMKITARDMIVAKGHDNHSKGPIMARDMKITARDMIVAKGRYKSPRSLNAPLTQDAPEKMACFLIHGMKHTYFVFAC